MKLTDSERQQWLAAETPADRKAVIKQVRSRERSERNEKVYEDAILDSLRRFREAAK